MHERSVLQCTLLYPAASLLLVVLLFQVTGRQIARAEDALAHYRQEAVQYRQTADVYQSTARALKQESMPRPYQALRVLLEQQTAGYSYE